MQRAREIIREVLDAAAFPAVLSSFGKESMLMLALVREIDPTVPVIWFRTRQDESFAKSVIKQWNLKTWSWEPSDVYVLPNDSGLSLIREQAFGEQRFPIVYDVEDGEECIGELLPRRTPQMFPHFDKILIGYKATDYHWTLGGSGFCPADGWVLGQAKVYAPLREYSDAEVWAAIRANDIPYDRERYDNGGDDPATVHACTNCLQPGDDAVWCRTANDFIPRVQWQPLDRLRDFRQRFGFQEVA